MKIVAKLAKLKQKGVSTVKILLTLSLIVIAVIIAWPSAMIYQEVLRHSN